MAGIAEHDWGGRNRTCNLPVNSRALCQLSYTPKTKRPAGRRVGSARATDAGYAQPVLVGGLFAFRFARPAAFVIMGRQW